MACISADTVGLEPTEDSMSKFHDLTMKSITGEEVAFSSYQGKTCLVVNVASA